MDPRPLTDAFRTETEPTDIEAARVHARLRASAATPSPRFGRGWAFTAGIVAAGIPAMLVLALLRGPAPGPAAIVSAPPTVATVAPPAAPGTSLPATVLDAPGEARELAAADGVALRYAGFGRVSGTATAPRIEWSAGTLEVEVEPGRGLDVQVQTREARVRVVGTGFTVARDVTGTAVAVAHGRVEVTCGDEPAAYLTQGESRSCLPVSAAGRLARARALREQGVATSQVLAETRDALTMGPDEAVSAELHFLELELLVDLGRTDEARAVGEALLAAPVPARGPEVAALLDRLEAGR